LENNELDDIERRLWNDAGAPQPTDKPQIVEIYKVCHEGAWRISDRRSGANTFFLAFHTAVLGALGALYKEIGDQFVLIAFFSLAVFMCAVWYVLLGYYRSLNSAKYKVIGAIERRLVASPFWRAEWDALDHGKNLKIYRSLAWVESGVPIAFAVVYTALAIKAVC
jgi:hypothetical protein